MNRDQEQLGGGSGGVEGSAADAKAEVENKGGFPTVPKALERLNEIGPPPFVTKTFEMVDDPETDPIVSWEEISCCSFVVWDPHRFSSNLLPKYFKHGNFSTFIRQLNTYGFRKVNLDRWEFANIGFQKGKKHLLKTIKRRNHTHSRTHNLGSKTNNSEEMENLKKAQDTLKQEICDIKRHQENLNNSLSAMEERLRFVEWKQRQLMLLLAKAMKRTPFFHQLLETRKKRRLLGPSVEKGIIPENDDILEVPTGNYIMWEKLMGDNDVIYDNNEAVVNNEAKYVHELEDLIGKTPSSGNFGDAGEVACVTGYLLL